MAKETAISLIKTIVIVAAFVITLTTTVFLGGLRIGKTEKTVEITNENLISIVNTIKKHDVAITNIKTEQAYQRGVIETKLDNLEKAVSEIKRIVSSWEPAENN